MIRLDLSTIFKGDKNTASKVVGYVIQKEDRTEVLDAALKEVGVVIDKAVEFKDGTVVYKQDDTELKDAKDVVAIKMDGDFVLLCKGFDPYSMTDGMSFGEILKSQGFMPGFSMATEALYTTIRNALVNAEDQKDAVVKIEAALTEFADYTTKLAGTIPSSAFKALETFRKTKDAAIEAAAVVKIDKPADVVQADWDKLDEAGKKAAVATATAAVEKAQKADKDEHDLLVAAFNATEEEIQKSYVDMATDHKKYHDSLPTHKRGAFAKMSPEARVEFIKNNKSGKLINSTGKTSSTNAAGTSGKKEEVEAMFADAAKAITEAVLAKVTEAVTKNLGEFGAKLTVIETSAKEALTLAKKTEKDIKGFVPGEETGDHETRKQERMPGEIGQFDTAFHKGVRKTDRSRYGVHQRAAL